MERPHLEAMKMEVGVFITICNVEILYPILYEALDALLCMDLRKPIFFVGYSGGGTLGMQYLVDLNSVYIARACFMCKALKSQSR